MRLMLVLTTVALAVVLLAACGGGASPTPTATTPAGTVPTGAGDPARGKTLFSGTCAACHGVDAKGIPGVGKNLVTGFAKDTADAPLVEFIKKGRDATDPQNTTGIPMPPKGGNPALTDQDLLHIVAYLRTLQ